MWFPEPCPRVVIASNGIPTKKTNHMVCRLGARTTMLRSGIQCLQYARQHYCLITDHWPTIRSKQDEQMIYLPEPSGCVVAGSPTSYLSSWQSQAECSLLSLQHVCPSQNQRRFMHFVVTAIIYQDTLGTNMMIRDQSNPKVLSVAYRSRATGW